MDKVISPGAGNGELSGFNIRRPLGRNLENKEVSRSRPHKRAASTGPTGLSGDAEFDLALLGVKPLASDDESDAEGDFKLASISFMPVSGRENEHQRPLKKGRFNAEGDSPTPVSFQNRVSRRPVPEFGSPEIEASTPKFERMEDSTKRLLDTIDEFLGTRIIDGAISRKAVKFEAKRNVINKLSLFQRDVFGVGIAKINGAEYQFHRLGFGNFHAVFTVSPIDPKQHNPYEASVIKVAYKPVEDVAGLNASLKGVINVLPVKKVGASDKLYGDHFLIQEKCDTLFNSETLKAYFEKNKEIADSFRETLEAMFIKVSSWATARGQRGRDRENKFLDLHPGQMGLNKDGDLVFLDIGGEESEDPWAFQFNKSLKLWEAVFPGITASVDAITKLNVT